MSLQQSFSNQGNFLFKYRGQFPAIIFLLSMPFIQQSSLLINLELLNILILLSFLTGFFIRFYTIGTTPYGTSGRNTKKQVAESLNTKGIYSIIRHPLYLGNYLIWLSISLYTFNPLFSVIMSLLFWIYYERIMYAEEEFLKNKFGEDFSSWSKNVPAFFPISLRIISSGIKLSFKSILRREYASYLSSISGFLFIDIIRVLSQGKQIYNSNFSDLISDNQIFFYLSSLIIVLILRTLKHYTTLLEEEGRS